MSLRNVWQHQKLIVSYCNWDGIRHFHTTISRSSQNRPIANAPPHRNPRRLFAAENPPMMPRSSIFTDSDIVKCNVAIRNLLRNGQFDSALRLFDSMPRKSTVTYSTIISGCFRNGKFKLAHQLFDIMPVKDVVSWTTILSGYVHNGLLDEARRVFDEMPVKDVVSWNTILSGYVRNGLLDEAKRVFDEMPVKDVISWTTILAGYAQSGLLYEARRVFDEMPIKDAVSWTTILSGYAQNGFMDEAERLFHEMPVKDVVSWTAMVSGYAQNGFLDEAEKVFNEMPHKNVVSWNAMITGYAQYNAIAKARDLFDRMPCRNCSSWATIIAGYGRNGDSEEALRIFVEATRDRIRLNADAFASALSSCADITATELGKQIHGGIVKEGVEFGCYVGTALVSMYCRCGSINEAYKVFERIEDKDVISWTTIIVGYARHGFGQEALQHFESMKQSSIQPDEVTMVGVLTACSHTGLVDKAKHYLYSMTQDHGIVANLRHYNCLIDALGRAGLLEEAQNLMQNMPFEPNAVTWGALLSASRVHGDKELAEKAAEMLSALDPWNSGNYVLLANLYAASGRWEDADQMWVRMRNSGVGKTPGYSWVEVLQKVHTFYAGDFTHPESDGIRALLDELDLRMREDGYVPDTKPDLHDVEEEEKQHTLRYHSERLAVAYAIMKIPRGRPVRVFKNLRVCEDCHVAIKHIARITGILIVLRDANRFHHFEGGVCSCGEYW